MHTVFGIEQVNTHCTRPRPTQRVFHRHDIIVPAVNNLHGARGHCRCQRLEARHEKRRREQKHTTHRQLQRRSSTHMPTQTATHQHEWAGGGTPSGHQFRHTRRRVGHALVVDGIHRPSSGRGYRCQGADLRTPRPAFLAVTEHDVSRAIRRPGMHRNLVVSHRLLLGGAHNNASSCPSPFNIGVTTRLLRTTCPSHSSLLTCSAWASLPAGKAMRPPAATTRCHGRRNARGASAKALATRRAPPGIPARAAIPPYVATSP